MKANTLDLLSKSLTAQFSEQNPVTWGYSCGYHHPSARAPYVLATNRGRVINQITSPCEKRITPILPQEEDTCNEFQSRWQKMIFSSEISIQVYFYNHLVLYKSMSF